MDVRSVEEVELAGPGEGLYEGNEEEESIEEDLQESSLRNCVDWGAISNEETLEEGQICGGR